MYRSPKDLKYRKHKSHIHSANHQRDGRSKLSVTYNDLTQEEYQRHTYRCNCGRCISGKKHKYLRSQLADPFYDYTVDIYYSNVYDSLTEGFLYVKGKYCVMGGEFK